MPDDIAGRTTWREGDTREESTAPAGARPRTSRQTTAGQARARAGGPGGRLGGALALDKRASTTRSATITPSRNNDALGLNHHVGGPGAVERRVGTIRQRVGVAGREDAFVVGRLGPVVEPILGSDVGENAGSRRGRV